MNNSGIRTGLHTVSGIKRADCNAAGPAAHAKTSTSGRGRLNLPLRTLLTSSTVAMSVMLSACAVAPGMHMTDTPSIANYQGGEQSASEWSSTSAANAVPAVSHDSGNTSLARAAVASDSAAPANDAASGVIASAQPAGAANLPVPISDINVALIQAMRADEARRNAQNQSGLFAPAEPYTLGPGDVLLITVWDHPELTAALGANTQTQVRPADAPAGFVVDQGGNIAFPYAGTFSVAGLRTDQVQAQLARSLARVYREPQITVRIASFRAKKVYIDGEVHSPGVQPINDVPMTLYEAVSRAGGFTSAADQGRMELLRDGVSYPIDLTQMIARQSNPSKIVLKDGDLLRVVSRDENGVFVMGEINKPMTAVPLRTGKLTLSEALSQAGSVNATTADAAQMYVIRGGDGSAPRVFHLDGRSPVSMVLASQFELQPKDVVYVDSTGLARFSRVLNQLLPAINAGLTAGMMSR